MIERFLSNPEVFLALSAVVAAALLTVASLLRNAPKWIDASVEARIKERLASIEVREAEFDARAMRDRAIADSINHAAGTNAQALQIIMTLSEILREDHNGHETREQLQQLLVGIERNNRNLIELNKIMNEAKNETPETTDTNHGAGSAGSDFGASG